MIQEINKRIVIPAEAKQNAGNAAKRCPTSLRCWTSETEIINKQMTGTQFLMYSFKK